MNASCTKSATDVTISDHAVVRWLERNNIVNIAQVRDQLAATVSSACDAADRISVSEFAVRRDNWKFVVRDHTLITVFPVKASNPHRRQRYHEELA